jgi:hypothetical protein
MTEISEITSIVYVVVTSLPEDKSLAVSEDAPLINVVI